MRFCIIEEPQRDVEREHMMLLNAHPSLAHDKSLNSRRAFSRQLMPRCTNQPALDGTK
ncbi:hypothetical protein SAMN04487914_12074 [Arthrobacter sp. ok909]|nr:hypothetical protein SAMN04487914_12074 [Arthrobacter sp. ok909]